MPQPEYLNGAYTRLDALEAQFRCHLQDGPRTKMAPETKVLHKVQCKPCHARTSVPTLFQTREDLVSASNGHPENQEAQVAIAHVCSGEMAGGGEGGKKDDRGGRCGRKEKLGRRQRERMNMEG